jgi:hypothetical protein
MTTQNDRGFGDRPAIFAYHRLGRNLNFSFNEEMADDLQAILAANRGSVEDGGQRVAAPVFKLEQTLQRLLERPAPHVNDHRTDEESAVG